MILSLQINGKMFHQAHPIIGLVVLVFTVANVSILFYLFEKKLGISLMSISVNPLSFVWCFHYSSSPPLRSFPLQQQSLSILFGASIIVVVPLYFVWSFHYNSRPSLFCLELPLQQQSPLRSFPLQQQSLSILFGASHYNSSPSLFCLELPL